MHYQGIAPGRPFPVDRPLNRRDLERRLFQSERIDAPDPYSDLSVIRLTSVYLEIVDKYYGWKGWAMFIFNAVAVAALCFLLFVVVTDILHMRQVGTADFFGSGIATVLFGSVGVVALHLGRFEWGHYTHYPIRLNRKTRMVHVFRKDGTVLSVPWDEVFFTLDRDGGFWEIRGHVLEADRETVRETFALGTFSTLDNHEGMPMLWAHWEFFRRYMEDGPEAVAPFVKQALPVDGKRESFRVGYEVLASHFRAPGAVGAVLAAIGWPIIAVSSLGRWVAMRLSRIPEWPNEIEEVNRVDADDPYDIDARINPPELR
ncbi:DUF6708 domain-containing protein [Luteimonas sp. JM171]|uniref:DUF6708 domain-containing protein n=1 Tax=Luteimonas sp. JM171 TaxID=1896164 RepID=UPI000858D5AD|nr:DUF6708 domain-containing protein [Luteimonas sp. JM171]AOH35533.1 hypothetical protein BGP89_03485 [Luteimonas sp. JM171]